MPLSFSPMSSVSPGGERDVSIDFTNHLETAEKITGEITTTDSSGVLLVENTSISTDGKSVLFHLRVITFDVIQTMKIYVLFRGDSGSVGSYAVDQPLVPRLTE